MYSNNKIPCPVVTWSSQCDLLSAGGQVLSAAESRKGLEKKTKKNIPPPPTVPFSPPALPPSLPFSATEMLQSLTCD